MITTRFLHRRLWISSRLSASGAPTRSEAGCEAVWREAETSKSAKAVTRVRKSRSGRMRARHAGVPEDRSGLRAAGIVPADIIATNIYPLSARIGELARKVRSTAGTVTVTPFEGIASVDGSFAIDAVAVSK